jgi:hypothetical protein
MEKENLMLRDGNKFSYDIKIPNYKKTSLSQLYRNSNQTIALFADNLFDFFRIAT